jgi:CRISPR-associated protein Csm2
MKTIVLDYHKDSELFNETAQMWAKEICGTRRDCGVKSTQLRNFYEKVMELEEKAERENFDEVLPFVKMLNSKVAYAKTRGTVNDIFVTMMNQCISQVNTRDTLKLFKLFFEAVIGFYPKK